MSKTAAQAGLRVAAGLALIFDLDGVIVDSMPVHELAWRRYLETLGFDGGDIPARMHGRRNDEIVRDFLGQAIDHDTVLAHGAAKERVFREMLGDRLRENLVAGIAEWLDHVEGAPIALATNAERANIDFTLDGAGLRRYFDVIVDGSEVSQPKPAPDVYLRAAELLKIAPQNCIVFEDSPVGVAAALAAGMRVVGVRTHSSPLDGIMLSVANFLDPHLDGWISAQRAV
ncbi:MAG TPA: HAD family phosphatase [Bryobacteraceae bacterium]|nr:HAD family phosphatase [Bryobacteraceae bacterium]